MTKRLLRGGALAVATLLTVLSSQSSLERAVNSGTSSAVTIRQTFENRPLVFEINAGQFAGEVQFGARARGTAVLLTDREAVLLPAASSSGRTSRPVRLRVHGSDASTGLVGERQLEGRVNYFIGRDPSAWKKGVPTYASVRRPNVYPGIDVVYHGRGQDLEFDFVVHPGADPRQIRLQLDGGDRVELEAGGDIALHTADGVFRHKAPELYQDVGGRRTSVGGRYVVQDGLVSFDIEPYDRSRTLVIDPVVEYSTYFTGTNGSSIRDLAIDASGNIYVAGSAPSTGEFPVLSAREIQPIGGPWDAFVAKITADGLSVVFLTFLGGLPDAIWPNFGGYETALGVGVHSDGSVFVCGSTTSKDFPVVNAFQPVSNDVSAGDGFVAKLSPGGDSLVFSTFLGGTSTDTSNALAVGPDGSVYVVGGADSPDFPVVNALVATKPNATGNSDAVITKLSASGAALFSTYWGGTVGGNVARGIVLSAFGDVIVAGSTSAATFPTVNGYDATPNGSDAFVTRFSADGTTVLYSTVLGGSSHDELTDVALGPNGHIFLTGWTISSDFPTANAYQPSNAGGFDWFVTKLDLSGTTLAFSTYIGGTGYDYSNSSIAVDAMDRAVVAGMTSAAAFPLHNAVQTSRYPTANDRPAPVAIKLSASGTTLVYSTYVGGSVVGQLQAVAIDPAGRAHLAGTLYHLAAPLVVTPNALQWNHINGTDSGFLVVIADDSAACTYLTSPRVRAIGITGGSGTFTAGAFDSGCAWSAVSNVPWIILTGSTSGSGIGTVPYVIQANFGLARMGTVTVNGVVFTVQQVGTPQAGCDGLDWEVEERYQAEGGPGQFSVAADFGPCTWHAASGSDWIAMTGPTSFNGSGVVSFNLAPNPSVAPRFGTIYVAGAATLIMQRGRNLIRYGEFNPIAEWNFFATPDPSYIRIFGGDSTLRFYREPPPPGTSNQAVVLQETGAELAAGEALHAQFDLANSGTVRKRISVLIHDSNFLDLSVCTFWLEPAAPLRTYQMRTHSTQPWTNATLSFYAASAGSDGGYYVLDNVAMMRDPAGSAHETFCEDPTTPAPTTGAPGPELLSNGDFSANLTSWDLFGQIVQQISGGVFEAFRPPGTPAGVVLQGSGDAVGARQIMTARFELGNSSSVRQRATVLLHEADFSDLTACTFWLSPGLPLTAYEMRIFTTKPWTNATISVYLATIGTDLWTRLDNVSLRLTPAAVVGGTDCVEPPPPGGTQSRRVGSRIEPGPGASLVKRRVP